MESLFDGSLSSSVYLPVAVIARTEVTVGGMVSTVKVRLSVPAYALPKTSVPVTLN